MRTPQRGDAIHQRQRGVRILGDVEHGEIEIDKGIHQYANRRRHHHELPGDRRGGRGDPAITAQRGPHYSKKRLQCRQHQGQHQGKVTQFGQHQLPPRAIGAVPAIFGGMYFSSCLASTSSATKTPWASRRPCAITPCPSRNRSGSTPLYVTGTLCLKSVSTKLTCRLPGTRCTLPA